MADSHATFPVPSSTHRADGSHLLRRSDLAFGAVLLVAVLLVAGVSAPLVAAPPAKRNPTLQPFDPQIFFDQFFAAADNDADQQALKNIQISAAEERELGDRAFDAFVDQLRRENVRVVDHGRNVDYLRQLVDRIRPLMRDNRRYRTIKVYVAESDNTDARCFPGGTLVFYRGLLDFAPSEAALVGIVGHELSHLDHGHQLMPIRRMKLAQQTFTGGMQGGPEQFFASGLSMMQAFMHPFRPEDEAEADRDGADWAYRAGYDPREMASLFLSLHNRDIDKPNFTPAFFRTHPFHIDRYHAILARYQELQKSQPKKDLVIGKDNLRQRVPHDSPVAPARANRRRATAPK